MQRQKCPTGLFGTERKGGSDDYDGLFDEEQIMKSFIKSERHDEARETAVRMIKKGKMSLEDIADCVPSLSFEELKELEAEAMQMA